MKTNKLDSYRRAYKDKFKFHNENISILSCYVQEIINVAKIRKFKSILSLGIGHQMVSKKIMRALKPYANEYVIIEGSSKIIDDFKAKVKPQRFVKITHAYFEDFISQNKFDCIEMGFVLEHVDDPLLILKKYAGMLKNNGRIFVAVPNARSLHRLVGKEAGVMEDMYRLSAHDRQLGHKRYFDCQSLSQMIKKSGLRTVRIYGLYLKPFSTSQLNSLCLSKKVAKALITVGKGYPDICNAICVEARK